MKSRKLRPLTTSHLVAAAFNATAADIDVGSPLGIEAFIQMRAAAGRAGVEAARKRIAIGAAPIGAQL